jgi:hyaluronate lyase
MMQLSPDGRLLSAKKSWFLFDDEIVALGADIRSTAAGKTVETIVENRNVQPNTAFTQDPGGVWANLGDAIGYYFPGSVNWQQLSETRTGAWRDINAGGPTTAVTGRYQTLWFDHGVLPAGATYSYVLLPGKNADDTAAYASAPAVQIAENDAVVQAVTHAGLGIQAANFWAASAKPAAGITSDAIASVLVHQAGGLINIAVADPTQANTGTIHIEVATAASAVMAQDDGVTVDQMSPTVKLSVNVRNARGKTFRVSLAP